MKTGKATHFVVQGLHSKLAGDIIVLERCVSVSMTLLTQPCKCQVERSGA